MQGVHVEGKIPNSVALPSVSLTHCCHRHLGIKMHRNVPFPDDIIETFSGDEAHFVGRGQFV